jgi:hypothetical protein
MRMVISLQIPTIVQRFGSKVSKPRERGVPEEDAGDTPGGTEGLAVLDVNKSTTRRMWSSGI